MGHTSQTLRVAIATPQRVYTNLAKTKKKTDSPQLCDLTTRPTHLTTLDLPCWSYGIVHSQLKGEWVIINLHHCLYSVLMTGVFLLSVIQWLYLFTLHHQVISPSFWALIYYLCLKNIYMAGYGFSCNSCMFYINTRTFHLLSHLYIVYTVKCICESLEYISYHSQCVCQCQ